MKKHLFFVIASAAMLLSACGGDDDKKKDEPKDPPAASCDANACKAATGNNYKGNICVGDVCGCNAKTDCNGDMICNASHMCVKDNGTDTCNPGACTVATGSDYKGNICVGDGAAKSCGCNTKSDCKNNMICNDSHVCVKDNGTETCDAAACAQEDDTEYKGNVCIDVDGGSGKKCGCNEGVATDCKSGYSCVSGACQKNSAACTGEERQCNPSTGVPEQCSGGQYVPLDRCADNETCSSGECKCNANAKRCDPTTDAPQTCGTDGNWDGTEKCPANQRCLAGDCVCAEGAKRCHATDVNYIEICDDKGTWVKQATACANGCNAGSCVENSCSSLGNGTLCDANGDLVTCAGNKESARTVCGTLTDEDYHGNVCVSADGTAKCGCNTRLDCRTDYICDNGQCVKNTATECDATACANAADADYLGDACIAAEVTDLDKPKQCGCKDGSACKSGYVCNTDASVCEKLSLEVNPCYKKGDRAGVCGDGGNYYDCADDEIIQHSNCRNFGETLYGGTACITQDATSAKCGCNGDGDCSAGEICDMGDNTCVTDE